MDSTKFSVNQFSVEINYYSPKNEVQLQLNEYSSNISSSITIILKYLLGNYLIDCFKLTFISLRISRISINWLAESFCDAEFLYFRRNYNAQNYECPSDRISRSIIHRTFQMIFIIIIDWTLMLWPNFVSLNYSEVDVPLNTSLFYHQYLSTVYNLILLVVGFPPRHFFVGAPHRIL